MFHKFAERYLCAVYRMRRLGIEIGVDFRLLSGAGRNAKYQRGNETRLDPLAFMLEGVRATGNCYADYANEHAIPPAAMAAFRIFLGGQPENSTWSRTNVALRNELQHFAYGVFYYTRKSYEDSRYYFDMVDELRTKLKIKQMITNPKANQNW